jgi:uncharacterized protein YjiS (DUF1127 family)
MTFAKIQISPSDRLRDSTCFATLAELVRRGVEWLVTKRRIRRGMNELSALDDRMLADIGLSRSGIDYTVRHGRS